MDATSLVTELRALLESEREAIRRLDAARVEEIATEKQRLVDAIATVQPEPLIAALRELVHDLRRNAVLLAHARDCLRDVIAAAAPGAATVEGRRSSMRPGARLSITG